MKINPLWFILIINLLSLLLILYFTHKNNIKLLNEKWLSNVRDALANLVGSCEALFLAKQSYPDNKGGLS